MPESLRNAFAFLFPLLVLTGCAQPVGVGGGRVEPAGIVTFQACRVSVTFAGSPEKVSANEVQRMYAQEANKYDKWEAEAWRSSQFRLNQIAICQCRDYPITPIDTAQIIGGPVKNEAVIAGIGTAKDYEQDQSTQQRLRFRFIHLDAIPNCVFIQMVGAPPANETAASPFFSSLTPASTSGSPMQPAAGAAAERLRQLDQLLKERLITQDEYDVRRRRILESL